MRMNAKGSVAHAFSHSVNPTFFRKMDGVEKESIVADMGKCKQSSDCLDKFVKDRLIPRHLFNSTGHGGFDGNGIRIEWVAS